MKDGGGMGQQGGVTEGDPKKSIKGGIWHRQGAIVNPNWREPARRSTYIADARSGAGKKKEYQKKETSRRVSEKSSPHSLRCSIIYV